MNWHDHGCAKAEWPHGHVVGLSQQANTERRDPAAKWGRGHTCKVVDLCHAREIATLFMGRP